MDELFSSEERAQVFDRVLALARQDARVIAAASVGSLAMDEADRWSDLDLTFAVSSKSEVVAVLDDIAAELASEFGAVHLFDLPSDGVLYRVLLLRGAVQVDISAAPPEKFGARGPNFRLLFGSASEQQPAGNAPLSPGYAVHHAVRARFCIERGKFWQAEFWLSAARDLALGMACDRLGLVGAYGRGFDQLPSEIQLLAARGLVRSLDAAALLDALNGVISLLLMEGSHMAAFNPKLEERLRLLTQSWSGKH